MLKSKRHSDRGCHRKCSKKMNKRFKRNNSFSNLSLQTKRERIHLRKTYLPTLGIIDSREIKKILISAPNLKLLKKADREVVKCPKKSNAVRNYYSVPKARNNPWQIVRLSFRIMIKSAEAVLTIQLMLEISTKIFKLGMRKRRAILHLPALAIIIRLMWVI